MLLHLVEYCGGHFESSVISPDEVVKFDLAERNVFYTSVLVDVSCLGLQVALLTDQTQHGIGDVAHQAVADRAHFLLV